MSATKLGARHLERLAAVYVRQSTPKQVRGNRESGRRQYGLVERAVEMGWARDRIRTIDGDQGQGAGAAAKGTRSGFDELCRLLALDQVGGVFGIEVSRLARNTVEWFQLLDLCRMHVLNPTLTRGIVGFLDRIISLRIGWESGIVRDR